MGSRTQEHRQKCLAVTDIHQDRGYLWGVRGVLMANCEARKGLC